MGLNSIRGRYLALAIVFLVTLSTVAWVAREEVRGAVARSLTNTTDRHQIRQSMRELTQDIWVAENAFYEYLLAPDMARFPADRMLHGARVYIDRLRSTPLGQPGARAHAHLLALGAKLDGLQTLYRDVMALRVDAVRLYPGLRPMVDRMLPAYNEFYTASTVAMMDAERAGPERIETYKAFADARHSWILMVGAFRLYVSYRFGIFPGDNESGMEEQASAIGLYSERLDQQLQALARLALVPTQQARLDDMRRLHTAWVNDYREVAAIYRSPHWRMDLPRVRDEVRPLFADIWSVLRKLDHEIDRFSAEDMTTLGQLADTLSRGLWWLLWVAVGITVAGLIVVEFAIRRPMARVAAALRTEAQGLSGAALPRSSTVEADDLVVAFETMRRHVHTRQQRLETILDNAAEGIITFDCSGVIEGVNRAAENLFGYAAIELVGKDVSHLFVPPGPRDKRPDYLEHFIRVHIQQLIGHEGEMVGQHKDGTRFPLALKVSRIQLEGRELYTGLVADISERKALLENLKAMAEHDGLTGLYNRSYFQEELERVVKRGQRNERSCAVLYIDLDNFKYVNDTLGHAAGDRLLRDIAALLTKRARRSDLVARHGGDEFTVLLYGVDAMQAAHVAESFRAKLGEYVFREGEQCVAIGCSIGIAMITPDTASADDVLSRADVACHLAKRKGRNCVHLYDANDQSSVKTMSLDMGWQRRIREAIQRDRFVLACQPIVRLADSVIDTYEVLVRLRDEQDELILPGGFLPSAERLGLAVDIDKWVVLHAIQTLAAQRARRPGLRYSINLSGQSLVHAGLVDLIRGLLADTGLDPQALTFEVTETVAIADLTRADSFLRSIRDIGCAIALDDFGAGFSSFAYLKGLPVDLVKIDGRFVKNVAANPVDQAMVRSMNDIAHALGKQTVAEWVEDEASCKLLVALGVDYAQGYYFSRPHLSIPCSDIAEHGDVPQMCLAPTGTTESRF